MIASSADDSLALALPTPICRSYAMTLYCSYAITLYFPHVMTLYIAIFVSHLNTIPFTFLSIIVELVNDHFKYGIQSAYQSALTLGSC